MISDSVAITMIGIVPTVLSTILSFVIIYLQRKNSDSQTENHKDLTKKVDNLTDVTNGKMQQLLDLTASSSKAEGILEQKNRE
jgi:hypothetical protein